jgi:hypothetical protein
LLWQHKSLWVWETSTLSASVQQRPCKRHISSKHCSPVSMVWA